MNTNSILLLKTRENTCIWPWRTNN